MVSRPTISLFTGAGGLDIGLEAAGFELRLCVEKDVSARETLRRNRSRWKLSNDGDLLRLAPREALQQAGVTQGELALLSGGPPCQPWSKSAAWINSGKGGLRLKDPRARTIVAYCEFVEAACPEVILLENVTGLLSKPDGLKFLQSRLNKTNHRLGTAYKLESFTLNAADYGVPQKRRRVFLLAHRDGTSFSPPEPTFGQGRGQRYRTAWDAIGHLDTKDQHGHLRVSGKWAGLLPSIPEGHNYLWHTSKGGGLPLFGWRTRYWSFLLKLAKRLPSWTLQAGPGPATGPFHWRNRQLSTEELAALQTFPKDFTFAGSQRDRRRQLGNAVPCALAAAIGLQVRRHFFGETLSDKKYLELVPARRSDCPRATPRKRVPTQYLELRGPHDAHPGVGRGPGTER